MCGIAGFVGRGSATIPAPLIESMTEALVHRGPDDGGFWGWEAGGAYRSWKRPGEGRGELRAAFGFRRLSILDLTPCGAQPMLCREGRHALVFNGQIYNYVELRREFTDVTFASTGDTEVLVNAFARRRLDILPRLKGMYAFAVHDQKEGRTWIVRDPVGIKPLYYFEDERGLFFASEIRALLAARREKPALNRALLSRYLMSNWVPDPDTLFEGIRKLEPGHYLEADREGAVRKGRHWDFRFHPEEPIAFTEWVDRLDAALDDVVSRQMRSDVPLGFFLSGGVDSSLLTAKAVRVGRDRPATFTTGFRWDSRSGENLDVKSARLMRDRFPLDYSELMLEPSIVSLLPKVVACLEEPIADPAAITSYLICQAAASRFKVLISGQGGDELFGGYPVYQAGWVASLLGRLPAPVLGAARGTTGLLPYSVAGREIQMVHRLRKVAAAAAAPWPETFLLLRSPFLPGAMRELLRPEVFDVQASPFGRHREIFEPAADWDRIHQMLYLDSKTYLPSLNLTYSDKTSMAHSVELRVPYLDPAIVEVVERVPARHKVRLDEGKVLLKAVAERVLPTGIVHRPKMGFGLPLRQWFVKELQPMAAELLSVERLARQRLFQPQVPQQWLREHREKRADHCMKLYSLMTFQLWADAYGL